MVYDVLIKEIDIERTVVYNEKISLYGFNRYDSV